MRLCECGCGNPTAISTRTRPEFGHIAGQPTRFARGHNHHNATQRTIWHFKPDGRCFVFDRHGRRHYWYRILIEAMLGRELQSHEIVHHINGDPTDDRRENLEILTRADHNREHMTRGDFHVLNDEDRSRAA